MVFGGVRWLDFQLNASSLPTKNSLKSLEDYLVGGFNPVEKYARQIDSFPQVGVKKKIVRNHHPVILWIPLVFSQIFKAPFFSSQNPPPWPLHHFGKSTPTCRVADAHDHLDSNMEAPPIKRPTTCFLAAEQTKSWLAGN